MARSSLLFVLLAPCSLLLLLTLSASAAVYNSLAVPDPAHPGYCLQRESGLSIPIGEWQLGQGKCEEYKCARAYGKLMITTQTCGTFSPPRGCVAQEDLSLPYPRCCYGMICS